MFTVVVRVIHISTFCLPPATCDPFVVKSFALMILLFVNLKYEVIPQIALFIHKAMV